MTPGNDAAPMEPKQQQALKVQFVDDLLLNTRMSKIKLQMMTMTVMETGMIAMRMTTTAKSVVTMRMTMTRKKMERVIRAKLPRRLKNWKRTGRPKRLAKGQRKSGKEERR